MLGADVMMGHDPHCARWIRKYREPRRRRRRGAGRARRPRRASAPGGSDVTGERLGPERHDDGTGSHDEP